VADKNYDSPLAQGTSTFFSMPRAKRIVFCAHLSICGLRYSRTRGISQSGLFCISIACEVSGRSEGRCQVRQLQVSLLMRNRAGNFSVGRLMEFLTALRQDVEITVRPTRKEHGALSVFSREANPVL
jgi:hypothetical protein